MLLSSKSYDTKGFGSHRPVGELVVGDKDGDSDGVFVGELEGYMKEETARLVNERESLVMTLSSLILHFWLAMRMDSLRA